FPAELEPAVASEIRRVLADSLPAIGFSSAAAGSDILFLEQMRSFEQPYHILLSGPEKEFVERSVSYAGAGWEERFRNVLRPAKSVVKGNHNIRQKTPPLIGSARGYLGGRA